MFIIILTKMFIEKKCKLKFGVMGTKTTTTKLFSTCTRIRITINKKPLNLNPDHKIIENKVSKYIRKILQNNVIQSMERLET
jgi:hypothetical protein